MSTSSFASKLLPIIQSHHSSSVPFPDYFAALKKLSVKQYCVALQPYTCKFEATDGEAYLDTYPPYDVQVPIAGAWTGQAGLPKVLDDVRNHVIDYHGFLTGAARTGVHHYVVDFQDYKVTYFSQNEEHSYAEPLPEFFKTM